MVLDRYRRRFDSFLVPMARAFMKLGPNALSALSLISALLAAIALIFWSDPLALMVAFIFIAINGFFDAIDGEVARISGRASPKGDLLDHVIDRYADFIIIAGISLSAFADARIGLIALGSIMIVSYMGTQSQALGLRRDYGGILGRADRLLLIIVFILLQYVFSSADSGSLEILSGFSLSLLDLLLIIFIFAANITILQRFIRIWRALS